MNFLLLMIILIIIIYFVYPNKIKEGYNRAYLISNKFTPTTLPYPLKNNWGYYNPYKFGDESYPHYKRYTGRYPYYRFGYNNVRDFELD